MSDDKPTLLANIVGQQIDVKVTTTTDNVKTLWHNNDVLANGLFVFLRFSVVQRSEARICYQKVCPSFTLTSHA